MRALRAAKLIEPKRIYLQSEVRELVQSITSGIERGAPQHTFPASDDSQFSADLSIGAASPATVARVESMVQSITRTWATKPKIIVMSSMQDAKVPEAVRRADATQKANGATGERWAGSSGTRSTSTSARLTRRPR